MNLCVLAPSADAASAGVRIRYGRIAQALAARGDKLRVIAPESLLARMQFEHDAYLVSKCYDARALLVAEHLRDSDKLIGVDLFDDYFSQAQDSRFAGLRYWLRALLRTADFALCSTPAMRDIALGYAPGVATHVMNDPAEPFDAGQLRQALRRKLERARRSRVVRIAWFGIGDNPSFPVGLRDLVAFGGELARLERRGFALRLGVLTNARALNADGLALLKRLAVPCTVEEWSLEREARLLEDSVACFLPVNAQSFSLAKSLNRAVSALCAGTQVLSCGYPLYEPLAPLVYRDPARLLDDIERGAPALREDSVPQLLRLMRQWADPAGEARALADMLEERLARKRATAPAAAPTAAPVALLHGRTTAGEFHKFAQKMQALSVCTPFCANELNFDVRIPLADNAAGFEVLIDERRCAALGADIRKRLSRHGKILGTTYRSLDPSPLLASLGIVGSSLARLDSPMSTAASYPHLMAAIERVLQRIFPGIRCYYSEQAPLPWSAGAA